MDLLKKIENNDPELTDLLYPVCEKSEIIAIGKALGANTHINHIYLYNKIDIEEATALAEGLKKNNSVEELILTLAKPYHENLIKILEGLKVNKSVYYLDLSYSNFDDSDPILIGNFLATNYSITVLILKENNISDKGALAIANALKTNNTLVELNLSYNSIGDEGAIAIADGLELNKKLAKLRLSYNNIENEGSNAIGDCLINNSSLRYLYLDHCNITDLSGLVKGLTLNSSLIEIDIGANVFEENRYQIDEILRLIKRNVKNENLRNTTLEEIIRKIINNLK